MKKLLCLSVAVLLCCACFAQTDWIIRNNQQGLYLEHKVTAKENFYSIGRLYNVHPKEIAAFNKLDMTKGLSLGQAIMIPLGVNFSQSTDNGTPVFYVVGEKEGLMRVSAAANDVPLASIRKWNRLESDNLRAGSRLIVGFLVAPQATVAQPVAVQEATRTEEKKEEKKDEINVAETVKDVPPQPVVRNENPKPAGTTEIPGDGYFRESFLEQIRSEPASKSETVTSGIFRTGAGWKDAKYYLLFTGVSPGTIVRLVNVSNSRIVYAKVLGEMSNIPLNDGYRIRISDAAAAALQVTGEEKFIVRIVY